MALNACKGLWRSHSNTGDMALVKCLSLSGSGKDEMYLRWGLEGLTLTSLNCEDSKDVMRVNNETGCHKFILVLEVENETLIGF